MKIVFASHNKHKLNEIQQLMPKKIELVSLTDLDFKGEIPETHFTLEENSLEKAKHIAQLFDMPCFADDTGLEVDALKGEPGVYSARYSGEEKSAEKNMEKVLDKLDGIRNRAAQFRTVIGFVDKANEYTFEGIIRGIITEEPAGNHGFGYDPIFIPEGYNLTFAEMNLEEKNRISHRTRAIARFIDFINHEYQS